VSPETLFFVVTLKCREREHKKMIKCIFSVNHGVNHSYDKWFS